MKHLERLCMTVLAASAMHAFATLPVHAQDKKPNTLVLTSDDTGWNDLGAYSGGGINLSHPTPNLDSASIT